MATAELDESPGTLYLEPKSFLGFPPEVVGPENALRSSPEVLPSMGKQYPSRTPSMFCRRALSFGRQATRRNLIISPFGTLT
jgi:hypothetical protein